ncbi:MAG: CooT family nickel-binding protein [Desulfamplus sp.]|nr:CooT family nickel-binding protein [Desulfamplus sp.]
MCESNVYFKKNNLEELIMENVAAVSPVGENKFLLKGLLGDTREIQGKIDDINLMAHKIVISALP